MRYLITGGAGFIGSTLVRKLINNERNIVFNLDKLGYASDLESIDNLQQNSMDFYASVKSLYLQDRERKIANSNTSLDTMDDSDWEEIDTK